MFKQPPDLLVLCIDDVTVPVDEVSLLVNEAAIVVLKVLSILRLDQHNLVVTVLVEDAHKVLDVKSLARIVEKLREVAVGLKLSLIKLLAAEFVDKVAGVSTGHPAVLINALALLIDEESLVSLE